MTPTPPRHLRPATGQAMFEYLVVLALVSIALIASTDAGSNAIDQLIEAIKGVYQAFSYALSQPAQHAL